MAMRVVGGSGVTNVIRSSDRSDCSAALTMASGNNSEQQPQQHNSHANERQQQVQAMLRQEASTNDSNDDENGPNQLTPRRQTQKGPLKRLEATQKLNLILPQQVVAPNQIQLQHNHQHLLPAQQQDHLQLQNSNNKISNCLSTPVIITSDGYHLGQHYLSPTSQQQAAYQSQQQQLCQTTNSNSAAAAAASQQLFDSLAHQLNQGQNGEVSLFTGLPSCTPASADRLASSAVNPFFWNATNVTNTNGEQGVTGQHSNGEQIGQTWSESLSNQNKHQNSIAHNNHHQQSHHLDHQRAKLTIADLQAASALSPIILSPLSLLGLSPEQEAWLRYGYVSPSQHPLANRAYASTHVVSSTQQAEYQPQNLQQQPQHHVQFGVNNMQQGGLRTDSLSAQHQQQQQPTSHNSRAVKDLTQTATGLQQQQQPLQPHQQQQQNTNITTGHIYYNNSQQQLQHQFHVVTSNANHTQPGSAAIFGPISAGQNASEPRTSSTSQISSNLRVPIPASKSMTGSAHQSTNSHATHQQQQQQQQQHQHEHQHQAFLQDLPHGASLIVVNGGKQASSIRQPSIALQDEDGRISIGLHESQPSQTNNASSTCVSSRQSPICAGGQSSSSSQSATHSTTSAGTSRTTSRLSSYDVSPAISDLELSNAAADRTQPRPPTVQSNGITPGLDIESSSIQVNLVNTSQDPTPTTRLEDDATGGNKVKKKTKVNNNAPAQDVTNENGPEAPVKKKSRGGRKKKQVTHEELMARKNRSKERNRVAARRCRQKRKQFLDELRDKIDQLNATNQKLQRENLMLKNELNSLKQTQGNCTTSNNQQPM